MKFNKASRKWLLSFLISFTVILLVGISAVACTSTSSPQKPLPNDNKTPPSQANPGRIPQNQSPSLAKIQTQNYSKIKGLALNKIRWLGSHDSGMYTTQNALGYDGISNTFIKMFFQKDSYIIKGFARTQSLDILQQLNAGVRYFDLRISLNPQDPTLTFSNLYLTHSVLGESLISVFQQIAQFISKNPDELIILDFNHWYYPNTVKKQQLQNLVLEGLKTYFGDNSKNLINKLNPQLKGSHLALNPKLGYDSKFDKFIQLNSDTNLNIIPSFTDNFDPTYSPFTSYNTSSLNSLNQDQNALFSYWTRKSSLNDIKNSLTQFINMQKKNSTGLLVLQLIINLAPLQMLKLFDEMSASEKPIYAYTYEQKFGVYPELLTWIKSQKDFTGIYMLDNAGNEGFGWWIYHNIT